MTSLRIAFTELERILSGRLPKLAVLALALVPTIYGGLYLYANHDPYENLDRVPAAIVVLDEGAVDTSGTDVAAGEGVADELVESDAFDWKVVGPDEAKDGVEVGRYDFALTIPPDFSAALVSSARFDPRQAQLTMTTNDANSFLSTAIADRVTDQVRDALAERVGTEAAESFLLGLSEIRGTMVDAADGAGAVADGVAAADARTARLASGANRVANGADSLETDLASLDSRAASLPSQARALTSGARSLASGNRSVATIGRRMASASALVLHDFNALRGQLDQRMRVLGLSAGQRSQLIAMYDRLGTPVRNTNGYISSRARTLDRLAGNASQVVAGSERLSSALPGLASGLDDAHAGASTLAAGADRTAAGATALGNGLVRLDTGASQLEQGLRDGVEQIPAVDDEARTRVARTIGDPVAVQNVAETEADSYGAGLAPFFMALAAWIGGYVLFLLVRPLSNRAMAANQAPVRVALGGWLTPALIGLVQVALLFGVVVLAIDIVPENTPLTFLFLALTSAAFVAILHALNAWFGPLGQFLGLVLLVLQLVTSGGTFPWQTIPEPLHWLHHALPMSYAVDGLRQLMYGGQADLALRDAGVLAAWLVGALFLASVAARRRRIWTAERIRPELAI
jgi:putative membrane protein